MEKEVGPRARYPGDEEQLDQRAGQDHDVFGDETGHAIQYKTLSWQLVSALMIAEIVSNGMLSLPSSAGVVGVSFAVLELRTLADAFDR
jgi:hypothetical protein